MAVPGIAAGIVIQPDNDFQNKAAQFTAANTEFLSIASNTSLLPTNAFSIGCWVYPTVGGVTQALMSRSGSAPDRMYALYMTTGNTVYIVASSDGTNFTQIDTASGISINAWSFIQAWYDGSNLNISVNNGTARTAAFSSTIYNGTTPFIIGSYAPIGSPQFLYTGRIDCAYFAKSDIGSTVRTSLYNSGNGKKWSQLTKTEQALFGGYWNLAEASGTRVDCTNNANHLSDNNTVTQAAGRTS